MNGSVVRVERLVPGGLGLAFVDGRTALVRGALPGEVVRAELRARGKVLDGKVLEVLERSPDRVPLPPGAPPTVDLGHADYAAQLRFKRGFVEDSLRRIGRLEAEVLPCRPSPREWAYRTAAQYLVTPGGVAYRGRGSHRPVRVEADPLVVEAIANGLPDLEPARLAPAAEVAFRASLLAGEVLVALIGEGGEDEFAGAVEHLRELGASGVSLAGPSEEGRFRGATLHVAGEETLLERFGRLDLSVSVTGFAQVNPPAAAELFARAAELAGSGSTALDLFGGAGALGAHLAAGFRAVTVVEINPEAVARGRADAGRLGLTNLNFVRADASVLRWEGGVDLVSLDPPRAGLGPEALERVLGLAPARILYVSCDPATWARDAARLVEGGYRLAHVQPWDFYPQTSHVEVLSLLERA